MMFDKHNFPAALLIICLVVGVSNARAEEHCEEALSQLRSLLASPSAPSPELLQPIVMSCPRAPEPHYALGVALARAKRLPEAYSELFAAVERKDSAPWRVALGSVCTSLEKLDEAAVQYQKALVIDPKNIGALQGLSVVEDRRGNLEKAISYINLAADGDQNNRITLFNRALLFERQSKFAESKADLERLLALEPEDFDAWVQLGSVTQALSQFDDSVRAFSKAVELRPKDSSAMAMLAQSYERTGDFDRSEVTLRRALDQTPKNSALLSALASVLMAKKQEGLAEEVARQATEADSKNARAWSMLGWSRLELGKHDDALTALNQALELNPADAVALNNRGVLYLRQGKVDEAKREFEAALRINPQLDSARENMKGLR